MIHPLIYYIWLLNHPFTKSHASCLPSYKIALHLQWAVYLWTWMLSCNEKPMQAASVSKLEFISFNHEKTQLASFDQCNNTGTIDVKMGGSALEEKPSFKMLGLTFSSKLDWGSYIILHYLWSLDSFHEVSFSWGCSVSL